MPMRRHICSSRLLRMVVLFVVFALFSPIHAAAEIPRQEALRFTKGVSSVTVHGRIRGYQSVDYQLPALAGQSLSATFKTGNKSAYFNVIPPESQEALFIGSISGDHFEDRLSLAGIYTIRVYLMRNAARRNEKTDYTLTVDLTGTADAARLSFDRTLELQGIRFRVTCENTGSAATVGIVPSGLEIDNTPIVRKIEGTVTGAEVADLNVDGSPEIYVYVVSPKTRSTGALIAYSANRLKSLSEIYLTPLPQDSPDSKGYRGHDEFTVLEGVLGHRFPLYRDSDADDKPTGGMRQLQYKLMPGEASWFLKIDRVIEY